MLDLKNISKDYYNANLVIHAVKNISVSFRKEEFVCIVGPSGCGKTTLLNLIGGLDEYTNGELIIDGITTKSYKSSDWDSYRNNRIGFVFQSYNLIFQLTVYENVEMALTLTGLNYKERKTKINNILKKVKIFDQKDKFPNQLSGGQMQRVAIARALVNDPDIILADEPTGALDSATADEVISILKAISNEKLVIMVTHNEKLAKKFSTRTINMVDGKLISDTNPYEIKKKTKKIFKENKSAMSFVSALKLSFKNLITKKLRTILTIIAGSVGIISVTLVLTISNGISVYIDDIQETTLANQPITIRNIYDYTDPFAEDYDLVHYPDSNEITIVNRGRSFYNHINKLSDNFINHIDNLDPSLFSFIDYQREVGFNVFTKSSNGVINSSRSQFTEMSSNYEFIQDHYDVIYGAMPKEADEIALLINTDNSIDARVLYQLNIDYGNKESFTFDEIMELEFRIIGNNDYYYQDDGVFYRKTANHYNEMYENGFPLKITGIMRPSKERTINLYSSTFLYTEKLTNLIMEKAIASDIVKAQIEYGLSRDVLDRNKEPFVDLVNPYVIYTKEYLYESQLATFGAQTKITSIEIYTNTFASRNTINNHLKAYNEDINPDDRIYYRDYMGDITLEFDAFVKILTRVLIVFAAIALFVSTIMIGIITYVSVIERTKEIGILRSLGARKIDIANVFNAETSIIGFTSGVLGVALGVVLINPIVRLIINILKQNNITTFDLTQMEILKTNPLLIVLIILSSILLTLIAGIIPAIVAANKSPVEAIRQE